jgi:DNA-binding NarL/FixJ family response regulator
MPNRRKTERNQEICKLYDNGKGLTQAAIALKLDMKESAVSMVIWREKRKGR